MDLGRLDDALVCFDAILEQPRPYPLAYYNRACVMALKGDAQQAILALEQAAGLEQQFLRDAALDPDFDRIRQEDSFRLLIEKGRV
jgi:tetratricopeptide (TPR) repeat protein